MKASYYQLQASYRKFWGIDLDPEQREALDFKLDISFLTGHGITGTVPRPLKFTSDREIDKRPPHFLKGDSIPIVTTRFIEVPRQSAAPRLYTSSSNQHEPMKYYYELRSSLPRVIWEDHVYQETKKRFDDESLQSFGNGTQPLDLPPLPLEINESHATPFHYLEFRDIALVSNTFINVIQQSCPAEYKLLPAQVVILPTNRRVACHLFRINRTINAVERERCDGPIEGASIGDAAFAFSPQKLHDTPSIFKVPEDPSALYVNEAVFDSLKMWCPPEKWSLSIRAIPLAFTLGEIYRDFSKCGGFSELNRQYKSLYNLIDTCIKNEDITKREVEDLASMISDLDKIIEELPKAGGVLTYKYFTISYDNVKTSLRDHKAGDRWIWELRDMRLHLGTMFNYIELMVNT